MRGVVTLAAAFTLPDDAPYRAELVLMALVVTAGTLVLQGSTLPLVARGLQVYGPDPREDALQLANVMQRAAAAGDHYLQKQAPTADKHVVQQIRQQAEMRTHRAWERLGSSRGDSESPLDSYRRLRSEMLQEERKEVLRLRDARTIDNEVVQEALDALDLEESMLTVIEERNRRYSERTIVTPERVVGDCDHLRSAPAGVEPRNPEGCEDCRREGTKTVNLRLCLSCGTVACCDSSPGRHAERHFRRSGHPVIRSFEPGEAWRWCYVESIPG
jgi:CPA1 family monovalent cation:H+ antiporter